MYADVQPSGDRFQDPGIEISYSKINSFRTCPWKYKLIYEEGWYVPVNPFIALGQSMHRTLEAFYRERVGTADHLFGCYNEQWVNEGFDSPQQAQEFFEKGEKMLSEYWTANKDSSSEVLQLEKEFIIELGSHRLRGTIDRIDRLSDGGYEVIDYKTHAELWDEQRASGDLQLSLYAIACTKSFGVPPARLSYYFLAHNRKISTTRTAQQLQEAIGIVQETAAKIMRREYGTNTAHCSRCDFKKKCPQSVCK